MSFPCEGQFDTISAVCNRVAASSLRPTRSDLSCAVRRLAMRFKRNFCKNKAIGELLSEFKVSQGPLFHYTRGEASAGIRGGVIWMTRADCFMDPKEIEHGLEVLTEAAQSALADPEKASFLEGLVALRSRLKSCYVLSLSQDHCNHHLRRTYGESVLEFRENFPMELYHTGWHSIPNSDDSFTCHPVVYVYDFFEGFVVYDESDQQRLARMACMAYLDCLSTEAHVVDAYQFTKVLMQCLVLFKSRKFAGEVEYRIALVREPKVTESFEIRCDGECRRRRIEVIIPSSTATVIREAPDN